MSIPSTVWTDYHLDRLVTLIHKTIHPIAVAIRIAGSNLMV
jgi:hypothetical protein